MQYMLIVIVGTDMQGEMTCILLWSVVCRPLVVVSWPWAVMHQSTWKDLRIWNQSHDFGIRNEKRQSRTLGGPSGLDYPTEWIIPTFFRWHEQSPQLSLLTKSPLVPPQVFWAPRFIHNGLAQTPAIPHFPSLLPASGLKSDGRVSIPSAAQGMMKGMLAWNSWLTH